jgi:hypothetical protein
MLDSVFGFKVALGRPVPVGWDDAEYALKGTGRVPLTTEDRILLGSLASRLRLSGLPVASVALASG